MSETEETKREGTSQPAAKRPMEKRKRLGITLGCIVVEQWHAWNGAPLIGVSVLAGR